MRRSRFLSSLSGFILMVLVPTLMDAPCRAENWSQFRGDDGTGKSTEKQLRHRMECRSTRVDGRTSRRGPFLPCHLGEQAVSDIGQRFGNDALPPVPRCRIGKDSLEAADGIQPQPQASQEQLGIEYAGPRRRAGLRRLRRQRPADPLRLRFRGQLRLGAEPRQLSKPTRAGNVAHRVRGHGHSRQRPGRSQFHRGLRQTDRPHRVERAAQIGSPIDIVRDAVHLPSETRAAAVDLLEQPIGGFGTRSAYGADDLDDQVTAAAHRCLARSWPGACFFNVAGLADRAC